MKINQGDFGYRAPELAPAPSVGAASFVNQGGDQVGQGFKEIGAAQSDINQQALADQHKADLEAAAEAKVVAKEAARSEAMTVHARTQNDLADAADQIINKIVTGDMKPDEATKLWQSTSKEIIDAGVMNVDKANGELVRAGLLGTQGTLSRGIGQAVTQRNRQEVGAGLDNYLEQMQRLGLKDYATAKDQALLAIDSNGPLSGRNPEQVQKLKQGFIETLAFNKSSQFLTENMNNGKALTSFLKALPDNGDIDPAKKNILEAKAMSMVTRLEAKADRAAASRLATVGAEVSAADSMILKGYEPSTEQMQRLTTIAKGTPYEPVVAEQVRFNKQTAAFRAAPPAQKAQFLTELEAETRKAPTPEGIATLEKMKSIAKAQATEIKTDVISYGQKNNLADLPPLDYTKSDKLGEQIAARLPYLRGMKQQYNAPMKPLSEVEAQQVTDGLKGLQPTQKADALRALTAQIGDGETVRQMASQIAPKDQSLSTAMLLASRDLQTTKGRTVAELFIKGQDAIKTKTAKIDDKAETGIRAQLAKELDGVYLTPEGRNSAIDATVGVYAGMRAEGQDDLPRATRLATGGLMTFNGGKIAKPYGYSDSMFSDAIGKVSIDDIVKQGGGNKFRVGKVEMTAAQLHSALPGAMLQTVDDGVYAIRADVGYVRRPDGKPLTLRVH